MFKNSLKEKIRHNEKIQSWILLLILSLIWGSSYILIKRGLTSFTPLQVGAIRITFAFLFMLPFALHNFNKVETGKWKMLFITGILGNLIPAILFAKAQTNVESSLAGILNALTPLFTFLIAVTLFKYKIKFLQVLGLVIGFIGTIGLSIVNSKGSFGNMNYYTLYIVAATICYAVSLILIKSYLSDMNSMGVASLSLFTIGPISLIILFSTDFFQRLNTVPDAWSSLGFICLLGLFGTAVGLILYTRLIQMTSPFFSSSVTYTIPIVAIMWGLLDGEVLFLIHFVGIAFILFGIYLINKME